MFVVTQQKTCSSKIALLSWVSYISIELSNKWLGSKFTLGVVQDKIYLGGFSQLSAWTASLYIWVQPLFARAAFHFSNNHAYKRLRLCKIGESIWYADVLALVVQGLVDGIQRINHYDIRTNKIAWAVLWIVSKWFIQRIIPSIPSQLRPCLEPIRDNESAFRRTKTRARLSGVDTTFKFQESWTRNNATDS